MQVWQDMQDLQSAYFGYLNLSFGSSILEALGTIWAPFRSLWAPLGLHFGAWEATLGPQGGPEGPRVEFDAILAPTWGPFWDHFGASGTTF